MWLLWIACGGSDGGNGRGRGRGHGIRGGDMYLPPSTYSPTRTAVRRRHCMSSTVATIPTIATSSCLSVQNVLSSQFGQPIISSPHPSLPPHTHSYTPTHTSSLPGVTSSPSSTSSHSRAPLLACSSKTQLRPSSDKYRTHLPPSTPTILSSFQLSCPVLPCPVQSCPNSPAPAPALPCPPVRLVSSRLDWPASRSRFARLASRSCPPTLASVPESVRLLLPRASLDSTRQKLAVLSHTAPVAPEKRLWPDRCHSSSLPQKSSPPPHPSRIPLHLPSFPLLFIPTCAQQLFTACTMTSTN
ncbi:hypothetical protein BZA05DRAFT_218612 [Tricharina praecox]|uniref:uncharacterized protein n=1 Tax=Tricharina praecox TaxID=43433 RepID=UPI00221E6D02|nr:uncharacterized protein BZA05DRAFT_218612 [Tricharina praecox]KAI5855815.1 hypothetical protein BZA05DRAFT_218612 [Tricharina praecox]